MESAYSAPVVTDDGNLVDVTEAAGFRGNEDGAAKIELIIPHHSIPVGP
jgi:hypothetical protein